jgi:hypothetical protein
VVEPPAEVAVVDAVELFVVPVPVTVEPVPVPDTVELMPVPVTVEPVPVVTGALVVVDIKDGM